MNYNNIFTKYTTIEECPFSLLTRSIIFPSDTDLPWYDKFYVDTDMAWTILSYRLYGSIEHWWVLASLNRSDIFYAKENTEILYIKKDYLNQILNSINTVNNG